MKHLWLLVALLAIMASLAKAEPILRDSATTDVTLYIAEWVWIDLLDSAYLDAEAGAQSAIDYVPFYAGLNTHAHILATLTPPPGLPAGVVMDSGFADWFTLSGSAYASPFGSDDELCCSGAGTLGGDIFVSAAGFDITQPAGLYNGGTLTTDIWVWGY